MHAIRQTHAVAACHTVGLRACGVAVQEHLSNVMDIPSKRSQRRNNQGCDTSLHARRGKSQTPADPIFALCRKKPAKVTTFPAFFVEYHLRSALPCTLFPSSSHIPLCLPYHSLRLRQSGAGWCRLSVRGEEASRIRSHRPCPLQRSQSLPTSPKYDQLAPWAPTARFEGAGLV